MISILALLGTVALGASLMMVSGNSSKEPNLFESSGDIGRVKLTGSTQFKDGVYTLTGAGFNMWGTEDAFHYAWKKVEGDVALNADIAFEGTGKNAHRKACLVIRQSLEADSAYADIALHGDGLTSLQYRDAKGSTTHEVQANAKGPTRLRLEKRGSYLTAFIAEKGNEFEAAATSPRIEFTTPFYIGLAVCSHEDDVLETALFSNVAIEKLEPLPDKPRLISFLETVDIASTDRRTVRAFDYHMEAPNWTPDGQWLVFNSGGKLYKIPPAGGEVQPIDTGFADRCNNDHGISPDGKTIVISDHSQGNNQSTIYTLPFAGGTPTKITDSSPSYWHGWSPDGQTLAFCAQRDGKFGIFTIPVTGGQEKRLTITDGLDDGPDYSPDGKHIYFNSDKSGKMEIHRIDADGSNRTTVVADEYNNWFAHVSPDSKWMVILSYEPEVKGHPANKDVMLRIRNMQTGEIKVLAKLFGGQGTINVPSWSPDSKRLAFVSYQFAQ